VQNINWKKWFDRMQPQTLQIATWLLYMNGFFALANFMDSQMEIGYIRRVYSLGPVYGLVVIAAHVLGGLLMANDLKIGYKIALVAAFSPFVSNLIVYRSLVAHSFLNAAFDIALVALLLHNQSRAHQKVWFH
jgi:predicted nicotinamide N-methyase